MLRRLHFDLILRELIDAAGRKHDAIGDLEVFLEPFVLRRDAELNPASGVRIDLQDRELELTRQQTVLHVGLDIGLDPDIDTANPGMAVEAWRPLELRPVLTDPAPLDESDGRVVRGLQFESREARRPL